MHPTLRHGCVAVAAAFCLTAANASADDDKATRDAQARFSEGLVRVKKADFEGARISFAQAYVVLHKPDILWNLALAEEKSGHPLDALRHFKELASVATDDADRANAQKHAAALMAQTGHIGVTAPAGAVVTVDGVQSAGTAPLAEPVDVTPGTHVVEGRSPNGTKTVTVSAAAGETTQAVLDIAAAPPSSPAAPSAGPQPGVVSAPAPVSPSPELPPDADSGRVPSAKIVTTAALGGAALVAIGAGIYFGLQSQSDASTASGYRSGKTTNYYCSATPQPAVCGPLNDAVVAQNRDATISNVMYVAGGVLAAGAVATWLLWPRSRVSASASVVPLAGPAGAGLGVVGQF